MKQETGFREMKMHHGLNKNKTIFSFTKAVRCQFMASTQTTMA